MAEVKLVLGLRVRRWFGMPALYAAGFLHLVAAAVVCVSAWWAAILLGCAHLLVRFAVRTEVLDQA